MLIVANGQSARLVDFDRIKAPIIAVNGAIDWLPRADLWFTLDMSEENRQRFDRQRPAVKYIACGAGCRIAERNLRTNRVQNGGGGDGRQNLV